MPYTNSYMPNTAVLAQDTSSVQERNRVDEDETEKDNEDDSLKPEDIEGAVIHEPVLPTDYDEEEIESLPEDGTEAGYTEESLNVNGYEFSFKDMRGNEGFGDDFDELNEVLNENRVAYVGQNNINTFFGHYYDLSGTGVFNSLADQGLLEVGTEVVITDEDGLSKGYEITQTIEFLHENQQKQFYGDDYMPDLAYYGNGDDMVYIQYCRWDIQTGLLITNIGYRIW